MRLRPLHKFSCAFDVRRLTGIVVSVIGLTVWLAVPALAQQQPRPDEVLRTNTELIQTYVTVLDKSGKFVDGLNREQFQLLIDGQPRAISFFDRVTGGNEPSRPSENRDSNAVLSKTDTGAGTATLRGRSIVFFIDDLHLSLDSITRSRKMLRHFVDNEMNSRDSVAIVSASGQVGFLQQFTNDKDVLTAAIERLIHRTVSSRTMGMGNVAMSDYAAFLIDSKGESRQNTVMNVYIDECLKQSPGPKDARTFEAIRQNCERLVKSNAQMILTESAMTTANTYTALEAVMKSNARVPGRKLAFFVSDGFLLETGHGPALREQLEEIIDSAQRAGVVIYTIDAKGLTTNMLDATNNVVSDPNGRMAGVATAEIMATQDALHGLARDTGGRALRNQNYFERWVDKVLDETSNYYVIAWRPANEVETQKRFRNILVSITDSPQLSVHVARGYLEGGSAKPQIVPASADKAATNKTPSDADLQAALADYYSNSSLPVALSLAYLDTPNNGMVLTSSIQIDANNFEIEKERPTFTIAGVILNDKGKIANSFKSSVKTSPRGTNDSGIIYNHRTPLAPGIYQVRVASRDDKTNLVGSALKWIVIPDLADRRLTLSSLLVMAAGLERLRAADGTEQVQLSVDHRYPRGSHLDWCTFIYNARRKQDGKIDLTPSFEILRDGRAVQTLRPSKIVDAGADPARIFFGGQLPLQALPPGRYELLVSVSDNLNQTTATRRTEFVIE